MKRKLIFIVFTIILTGLIPAASVSAWTASDIRPADENSDPANYSLIIKDEDGWELRMNVSANSYYYTKYRGVVVSKWGSKVYTGDLRAVYNRTEKILVVSCTDSSWSGEERPLSYALQYTGVTRMKGCYLYFDTGGGKHVWADIVKGALTS